MLVMQYLAAEFVKTCEKKYEIFLNQYLKPDFEPQPVCHFLTYFSSVCTYFNALESGLRISKSHVGAAIFGCEFCENMRKKMR